MTAEEAAMTRVQVFLENGFDHDEVVLRTADDEQRIQDVTTRYQIGLATMVDVELPEHASVVQVAVPARMLAAETVIDPSRTPYVRVEATDGSLVVRAGPDPPMYA
jgi:hypothetical protein